MILGCVIVFIQGNITANSRSLEKELMFCCIHLYVIENICKLILDTEIACDKKVFFYDFDSENIIFSF